MKTNHDTYAQLTDAQKVAILDCIARNDLLPFHLSGGNDGVFPVGFELDGMFFGCEPDGYLHT